MAKLTAAWGIDIGQCALKAIRCQYDEKNPRKITADAFDYIEYPTILTQPEADREELVRAALKEFLDRNEMRGTKVAVSVSGQSGLARFIKLPPVETKKIPDIVRYEANQQIPFDLEDVIWDYQRMFGAGEEEGFALETEVGLFAMKREQVYEEIEPYMDAGIDIDVVQLTPLAIYNFVVFDQIGELPPEDEFDPEDPPPSTVVLSIGTESTDLVITNGFRVWQRSVPLGGSHFTKALVKDLQQTYAKAEHLKRNATQAEDPKAIYQSMRPVFKDLLTEIQRSIGYFHSLDRTAKIGRVVALGNSMKLPGLKRYLSQHLDEEIHEASKFSTLAGPAVTESPAFKENILAFGVPYGLALQGLGVGRLGTNLVPQEIVRDRIINRKKPWGVAATVMLALGCLINFLILWWPWSQVRVDKDDRWKSAKSASSQLDNEVKTLTGNYQKADQVYQSGIKLGDEMVAPIDRRLDWLNLDEAIFQCLPQESLEWTDDARPDPKTLTPIQKWLNRETVWVTDMRPQYYQDLSQWYSTEQQKYQQNSTQVRIGPSPDEAGPQRDVGAEFIGIPGAGGRSTAPQQIVLTPPMPQFPPTGNPTGPGYVIQLTGYHFHDSNKHANDVHFVRRTLVHNLQDKKIKLPDGQGGHVEVPIRDMGISHPLVYEMKEPKMVEVPDMSSGGETTRVMQLKQYNFVVQFAWSPQKASAGAASPNLVQAGQRR